MALPAIMALLALFLMFRSKQWGLGLVCVVAGLFLAATPPGQTVVETITSVSRTIESGFKG